MKKLFSLSIAAMLLAFASQATITGNTSGCLGTTGYLTDSLHLGGVWSSSNPGIATVNSVGNVFGVTTGTTIISYTYGSPSTIETATYTVTPAAPPAITGVSSVCVGTTTSLSNAVAGGTWSSSIPGRATVDPVTGVVTGVSAGSVLIYYYAGGSSCPATIYITVTSSSGGSISGPATICASGGTGTMIDSSGMGSGIWSSSNAAVATIDPATGVVTGVGVGTVTITYSYTGTCGAAIATRILSVINTTSAGTISGSSSVNVGASGSLYSTVSGGTWSSSNAAIATVNASTGVYTGVAAGAATITYTKSGCGGIATTTYNVTVTTINGISGNVNFSTSTGGYYGSMKIWLITYNPATQNLEAVDSIYAFAGGMSKYYEFLNVPTDSYRVKAAVYDSLGLTTGYIPTYHTSSFYWHSATVINHVAGTADMNKDITMMIGTPTTGPGFIGGNVTTGANRGTTTGDPVEGLSMNVLNSSNQLMQSVRTDVNGNYSFTDLPVGTYYIFPDSLNYMTTAYTSITLTAAAPVKNGASFTQDPLSKTIMPKVTAVNTVNNATSSVLAFPNPASSTLNLKWTVTTSEKANVTISDITGREVYTSAISMNAGTGVKQIDLSSFINGLYVISVKSATLNYTTKIQVQH